MGSSVGDPVLPEWLSKVKQVYLIKIYLVIWEKTIDVYN